MFKHYIYGVGSENVILLSMALP